MSHRCPEGHETTYQAFSGGRSWYCETCDDTGDYDYESMPEAERPRAWLLTQPGGPAELKRQMREELRRRAAKWPCTHPGERVFDPADGVPLPEVQTCTHDECRPAEPQSVLDAPLSGPFPTYKGD